MRVPVFKAQQILASQPLDDIESAVQEEITALRLSEKIRPGQSVAIGCSSRGIANYGTIISALVRSLQALGLEPFLFPAMGSHGAATAEGQKRVIEGHGISEQLLGVSIKSSLDTVEIGRLSNGLPVLIDRYAYEADHIIVANRIRSHTEFSHVFESGLMKIMAIGMGKERGATLYHKAFMVDGYPSIIQEVAETIMDTGKLLFGLGIVEDGLAQTAKVKALPAGSLLEGEIALLKFAQSLEPRLPFDDVDVLIIDEMGKDISGSGFDAKVVGRINMPLVSAEPEKPRVKRIVVLDLTDISSGNADGVGSADFITKKLYNKIDMNSLYVNALAGSEPEHARIPMVMKNAEQAITTAMNTVGHIEESDLKVMRIRNTKQLGIVELSASYKHQLEQRDDLVIIREQASFAFENDGELAPLNVDVN